MNTSPWLLRAPQAGRRLRLYCFSYAGGSAHAYASWQAALGADIDVCALQLPGRGMRMMEQPYTSLPKLVDALGQLLARQDRTPFAFFGHSLGALLAFELTRYCARHGLAMPEQLIVSGTSAPQHREPSRGLHTLPDEALIAELELYNGTPPEVLQHRELMELLLPTIRGDFALAEQYVYRQAPLLTLPITVYAGRRDPRVSLEQASEWRKESSGACQLHWFEGDHFFINSERDLVLECVSAQLASPPLPYPQRSQAIGPPEPVGECALAEGAPAPCVPEPACGEAPAAPSIACTEAA